MWDLHHRGLMDFCRLINDYCLPLTLLSPLSDTNFIAHAQKIEEQADSGDSEDRLFEWDGGILEW